MLPKYLLTCVFLLMLPSLIQSWWWKTTGEKEAEKTCIKKLTNGCSAPSWSNSNIPTYNKIFLPACSKHDVCYGCGEKYQWTKLECDRAFFENMKTLCYDKYNKNAKRSFWWEKSKVLSSLPRDLRAWRTMPKNTLQHCLKGATIYYKGVFTVADLHYGGSYKSCDLPCAQMGDPKTKDDESEEENNSKREYEYQDGGEDEYEYQDGAEDEYEYQDGAEAEYDDKDGDEYEGKGDYDDDYEELYDVYIA